MNNVRVEANDVMPKCIADYEKGIMENLVEIRTILSSIYRAIVGGDPTKEDIGSVNTFMENASANYELTIQIREIAKDINRVLFNL